jgi:hypothetical protein
MSRRKEKFERLVHINQLIWTISKFGRRFFYYDKMDRTASMSISDAGHIYFHDDYTDKPIYVAYRYRWHEFSHGGTLKELVKAMAHYIRTGDKLSLDWIGPDRRNITDGNIWGYAPEDMAKCRAEAALNPAIEVRA